MKHLVLFLTCLSALASVLVGCEKDACTAYQEHETARYKECGLDLVSGVCSEACLCTDTRAEFAHCADACLPKLDCECVKDPTRSDCEARTKPYSDCFHACY